MAGSLTRRAVLGLGAAGLGGLLLPRRASAALDAATQRRFVFLFCPGGWDPAYVFAPVFSDGVQRERDDAAAAAGGLVYVDGARRPSVRAFFEAWGDRTCFVNGVQVQSVAHDVCTRLTMTGGFSAVQDDWISIVAGAAGSDVVIPNLHVDGPLFPQRFPTASVRVGADGQLAGLLAGELSGNAGAVPSAARQSLADAALRRRVERYAARNPTGAGAELAAATALALDRAAALAPDAAVFASTGSDLLSTGVDITLRAFALGLARTATLAYGTGGNGDWDTHADNAQQASLFDSAFGALNDLCEGLDALPGAAGGTMLDETTLVVLSEMGRTPNYNSAAGKDHWPFTTAMFVGSGVRGGRVIGGYTDGLEGQPVDRLSGEVSSSGEQLFPGHIGATILTLAGIEPGEWVGEGAVEAVIA
jgi:uncharacterized protein (DUF1501 family)